MTPDPATLELLLHAARRRPENHEHDFSAAARRVQDELFKLDMAYDSKPLDNDLLIWEVNVYACFSGVWLDWLGAPAPRPMSLSTLNDLYAAKADFDAQ